MDHKITVGDVRVTLTDALIQIASGDCSTPHGTVRKRLSYRPWNNTFILKIDGETILVMQTEEEAVERYNDAESVYIQHNEFFQNRKFLNGG